MFWAVVWVFDSNVGLLLGGVRVIFVLLVVRGLCCFGLFVVALLDVIIDIITNITNQLINVLCIKLALCISSCGGSCVLHSKWRAKKTCCYGTFCFRTMIPLI